MGDLKLGYTVQLLVPDTCADSFSSVEQETMDCKIKCICFLVFLIITYIPE